MRNDRFTRAATISYLDVVQDGGWIIPLQLSVSFVARGADGQLGPVGDILVCGRILETLYREGVVERRVVKDHCECCHQADGDHREYRLKNGGTR